MQVPGALGKTFPEDKNASEKPSQCPCLSGQVTRIAATLVANVWGGAPWGITVGWAVLDSCEDVLA